MTIILLMVVMTPIYFRMSNRTTGFGSIFMWSASGRRVIVWIGFLSGDCNDANGVENDIHINNMLGQSTLQVIVLNNQPACISRCRKYEMRFSTVTSLYWGNVLWNHVCCVSWYSSSITTYHCKSATEDSHELLFNLTYLTIDCTTHHSPCKPQVQGSDLGGTEIVPPRLDEEVEYLLTTNEKLIW